MSTTNTHYISDDLHYWEVVERMVGVKRELWIGTADIKDVYVKKGRKAVPLLEVLATLLEREVNVRLIHAKEFCPAFREDFDKYPTTVANLHRGRQSHGSGAGHEKCTAPQL